MRDRTSIQLSDGNGTIIDQYELVYHNHPVALAPKRVLINESVYKYVNYRRRHIFGPYKEHPKLFKMFHECKLFDPHRVLEDGGIMSNTILVDVPTEVINGYLACINPLRLYVMDTHNMPNFMSISRNDYLTKDDKGSTLNFKDDHHDLFILGQTTNSYWFFWIDGIDHEEHCIGRITKNKISEDELVKLMLLDMASERKLFVELEVGDFNIV